MRVNWIFATGYQLGPDVNIDQIKSVGATWGSWRTWRSCGTDNVICHDRSKCVDLIGRAFQAVCNFYVPKSYYQDLNRPMGVKLYEGDFNMDITDHEDIVAMNLVADISDIVLLVGFDFSLSKIPDDKFDQHKLRNYHGLARSVINSNQMTQWVLIDHSSSLDKAYQNLPNLTCDTMKNTLQLLI